MRADFLRDGFCRFAHERTVADWAAAARIAARPAIADPAERAKWLDCEGTWFVGVDALPNDAAGAVAGGGPLAGAALDLARALYGDMALHRGQVSVVYPGYPRARAGESDAALRYRRDRDAAHVDGLLPVGEARRRMVRERHAYILGLPLSRSSAGASPLVVWQGSHHVLKRAFERALRAHPPEDWGNVDLTDAYHAARRTVFASCARIALPAQPGEAYLIHRHALHGVTPWDRAAKADPEGRMIAYFRPEFVGQGRDWLDAP